MENGRIRQQLSETQVPNKSHGAQVVSYLVFNYFSPFLENWVSEYPS
jgi:hypothetical protein